MLRKLSQQTACVLAGLQIRTLRDSDAPRNKDRSYDAPKLVKWLVDREKAKRKVVDLRLIDARIREEQLRERKRKNDVEENLLLSRAEVEGWVAVVFKVFREQAISIEQRHGAEVGAAIRGMVDAAFSDSKKNLARRA